MTVQEDHPARRAAAQHAVAEHLRLTAAGHTEEWVQLFARTRCSSSRTRQACPSG